MIKIKNNLHETWCDYTIDKDSNDVFFFMHGYMSSNKIWDFVTPEIKGSKIMIPFILHENSFFVGKKSKDMIFVIDHIFNELKEKLNLQKKRKILIVHSVSGATTLHYLNNYRNIFDKIIFVTPAIAVNFTISSPLFYLLNFLSYDNLELFWEIAFDKTKEIFGENMQFKEMFIRGGTKNYLLPEMCSEEWIKKYYDSVICKAQSLKIIMKFAREMYTEPNDPLYPSYEKMDKGELKNKFDTLTIACPNDHLVAEHMHELNNQYLNGKIVYFNESSHMPMLEENKKFIETIKDFVC